MCPLRSRSTTVTATDQDQHSPSCSRTQSASCVHTARCQVQQLEKVRCRPSPQRLQTGWYTSVHTSGHGHCRRSSEQPVEAAAAHSSSTAETKLMSAVTKNIKISNNFILVSIESKQFLDKGDWCCANQAW